MYKNLQKKDRKSDSAIRRKKQLVKQANPRNSFLLKNHESAKTFSL